MGWLNRKPKVTVLDSDVLRQMCDLQNNPGIYNIQKLFRILEDRKLVKRTSDDGLLFMDKDRRTCGGSVVQWLNWFYDCDRRLTVYLDGKVKHEIDSVRSEDEGYIQDVKDMWERRIGECKTSFLKAMATDNPAAEYGRGHPMSFKILHDNGGEVSVGYQDGWGDNGNDALEKLLSALVSEFRLGTKDKACELWSKAGVVISKSVHNGYNWDYAYPFLRPRTDKLFQRFIKKAKEFSGQEWIRCEFCGSTKHASSWLPGEDRCFTCHSDFTERLSAEGLSKA